MNSKVLIIASMHRSGSSLVTQWLQRCGLPIGKKLMGPDIGNLQGHFEDMDFLTIHQQLLTNRKSPSTGFVDHPPESLTVLEKDQLRTIIENKKAENEEWAWKDPRTSLFLNEYAELIPSAFYLFIIRDFHTTVSSLLTREYKVHIRRFETKKGLSRLKWKLYKKKTPEQMANRYATFFLKMWIHYYTTILDHVKSLPGDRYMFVHYTGLLQNDKPAFTRLKEEWKFSLEHFPFADVYKKELLSDVQVIEKYIKDKELIAAAQKIELECNAYLTV